MLFRGPTFTLSVRITQVSLFSVEFFPVASVISQVESIMKNQLLTPNIFQMKNDFREVPRDSDQQQILVQSDQQLPEQGQHEPIARPKIPKNKLPSVFIPASKKKREDKTQKPQEPSQENEPKRASTDKLQRKQPDGPPRKAHTKKSMNPLIPARNQIRLFDKLQSQIMEARQNYQRFAKLNIDKLATPSTPPLRLQQSLTLSQRPTARGSLLKRILNVPSFRILYLQQLHISSRDTPSGVKSSLQLWDNCSSNPYQLRTHAMFWNMPQGNLSILYDYEDMYGLAEVADSAGYLPEGAVREVLRDWLQAMQLVLREGVHGDNIEEGMQLSKVTGRLVMQPQVELRGQQEESVAMEVLASIVGRDREKEKEKGLLFRLGFTMLRYSIGGFEFAEEIEDVIASIIKDGKIVARNTSCCLLHSLDAITQSDPSSFPLYRLARRRFSPAYSQFLCQTLKYFPQHTRSNNPLDSLKSHPFLTSQCPTKVDLKDLLRITTQQCQQIRDFSKIEQTIDLVLSNCVKVQMPQFDTRTVQVLAEQTGVDAATIQRRISALYASYAK